MGLFGYRDGLFGIRDPKEACIFVCYFLADPLFGQFDIRPGGNIALAFIIPSYSNHGAICPQAYCVVGPCTNSNNIRPGGNIALAVIILSYSNHGAICLQAYCVVVPCANSNSFPLTIYFTPGNVYMPVLLSQFTLPSPSLAVSKVCSLSLCLYSCSANRFISTFF